MTAIELRLGNTVSYKGVWYNVIDLSHKAVVLYNQEVDQHVFNVTPEELEGVELTINVMNGYGFLFEDGVWSQIRTPFPMNMSKDLRLYHYTAKVHNYAHELENTYFALFDEELKFMP